MMLALGCTNRTSFTAKEGEITEIQDTGAGEDPVVEIREDTGIIEDDDCSNTVGNRVCNLVLLDQYGDTFHLYDHLGKVVVLDFSAGWCGPCRSAATHAQSMQDAYGTCDLTYATVLVHNEQGENPCLEDVQAWAKTYGMTTAPVLQGYEGLYDSKGQTGWDFSWIPAFFFIDQDMYLRDIQYGWNEKKVAEKIENLLLPGG
jgi:thiol-disulfide isomerase/thioredoxin